MSNEIVGIEIGSIVVVMGFDETTVGKLDSYDHPEAIVDGNSYPEHLIYRLDAERLEMLHKAGMPDEMYEKIKKELS